MFSYPKTSTSNVALVFVSFLALSLFSLLVPAVFANSPKLNSISPSGGQRGAEMEIRFNGQRLESAQGVIFFSPGIEVLKLDPARTNAPLKARLPIPPHFPLGGAQPCPRTPPG